jgi:hypothetical protein
MSLTALCHTLQHRLGTSFSVVEHEGCVQVLDGAGNHVALVGQDPLQLEAELSVVLADDGRPVEERAAEADRMLRGEVAPSWRATGFVVGAAGEVHEGEAVDDPEHVVWSYELPVTTLARDTDELVTLVHRVRSAPTDFVLWGPGGPLTALT